MADTAPDLHWSFTPSQPKLKVKVGEPVLAFYKATNNRDKPVTGVATYNVTPMKTGFYFHKIQWSAPSTHTLHTPLMPSFPLIRRSCW